MKPSQRITQIINTLRFNNPERNQEQLTNTYIGAIVDYLDEEYEKNNQKEPGLEICEKCGFSGEIDKNGICWSSECDGK